MARPGGGIGRHWGLKIPCSKERAGSSPASGTIYEQAQFHTEFMAAAGDGPGRQVAVFAARVLEGSVLREHSAAVPGTAPR